MSDVNSTKRYAIYFAPEDSSALEQLGSGWLGRNARTGETGTPVLPPTIPLDSWRIATESPRRYGFHGTLKPPFRLKDGRNVSELKECLGQFATRHRSFELPRLTLGTLGRFLALILSEPSSALHELADDCVRDLDNFRAQPSIEDLARRMSPSLNDTERQNLLRWGYPYVFDTWKFHLTLTSSLKPEELNLFRDHLAEVCKVVCEQPLRLESICLFEEPAPNHALRLIERYPLGL